MGVGFLADGCFEGLALAVVGVEFLGELSGGGRAVRVEECEGVFGGVHSAGGVDSGADAETDVGRCGDAVE